MKLWLMVLLCFLSFFALAQQGNTEQKAAIGKLSWMKGNWTGTSFVNMDTSQRITNIRESVEAALDGTILLIKVRATDKDSATNRQSLAYTSFSVISYNTKSKTYKWTTWRNSENDYDQYEFTVGEYSFEYKSKENGRLTRYKANMDGNGEFRETGEYSKDGTSWTQFITMKLVKYKQK